jgi:hypothetical protein
MNIQKEIKLRQGGNCLRLTMPVDIVRAFGLSADDSVLLEFNEHVRNDAVFPKHSQQDPGPGWGGASRLSRIRQRAAWERGSKKKFPTMTSHVRAMYEPCTSHVRAMYEPCTSHVRAMYEPCTSHVRAMYEPETTLQTNGGFSGRLESSSK